MKAKISAVESQKRFKFSGGTDLLEAGGPGLAVARRRALADAAGNVVDALGGGRMGRKSLGLLLFDRP